MVDVISAAPCFLVVCFQRKRRKPAFVHCHVLSVHSSNGVIHHTYIIIPTVMYHSSSPSLSQASRFNHSATLARMSTGGPATRSLLCTHPSKDGPGFATYSNRACSNHESGNRYALAPTTPRVREASEVRRKTLAARLLFLAKPEPTTGYRWKRTPPRAVPDPWTEGNHGLLASPCQSFLQERSRNGCTVQPRLHDRGGAPLGKR